MSLLRKLSAYLLFESDFPDLEVFEEIRMESMIFVLSKMIHCKFIKIHYLKNSSWVPELFDAKF